MRREDILGLVFFALWQVLLACVGYTYIGKKRKRISKRIGSLARAITAGAIALGAFKYATSGSSGNQTEQQQELTAQVLTWPGGQLIVGAVAIGVLIGLAASTADPEQSGGMDKALHTLAAQPYGMFLLAAVAIGIAAFGVYCFVAARALKQ